MLMDESVEEIDLMSSGKLGNNKENQIGINGSDEGVEGGGGDEVAPAEKPKNDPITELGYAPSLIRTAKGKGLRKWRRIRREVVKDGSDSFNSSKAGKRACPPQHRTREEGKRVTVHYHPQVR